MIHANGQFVEVLGLIIVNVSILQPLIAKPDRVAVVKRLNEVIADSRRTNVVTKSELDIREGRFHDILEITANVESGDERVGSTLRHRWSTEVVLQNAQRQRCIERQDGLSDQVLHQRPEYHH